MTRRGGIVRAMRHLLFTAALAAALLAVTSPPRAAEPEPGPEVTAADAPPASTSSSLAEQAYLQAREAFDRGAYDDALRLLQLASREDEDPVYVYNMARVLERMGRNSEAYSSFLRVRALPEVPEALAELAWAAIETLEPLRARAVVRFSGVEPGSLVQIDDELVVDLVEDHVLKPGRHRVCVTSPDGARLSCWRRTLPEGRVTSWPPDGEGPTRGEIHLPTDPPLTSLTLDGRRMVVDLRRLRVIQVDVGTHEVLAEEAGSPLYRHSLDVFPGAQVAVPRTGPLAFPEPKSVGPWPWVTAGTGLAVLVTGGVLLGLAPGLRDVATNRIQPPIAGEDGDRKFFFTVLTVTFFVVIQ